MSFIIVSCYAHPISKEQHRVILNTDDIITVWEKLIDGTAVIEMRHGAEYTTVNKFDDVKEKIRTAT